MKLQNLTVIFIIIIIPVILLVSLYVSTGLKTINYQSLYDSGLLTATHAAIYAFESNTANDELSINPEIKRSIIKSSIKMFERSLCNTCGISAYNADDIEEYIPAIVFGMYDGFYMYAPSVIYNEQGKKEYKHNLKNYVYYSETLDDGIVIIYSLDNHVTVSGNFGNGYEVKEGYLAVGASEDGEKYQGIEIVTENIDGQENTDGINYHKDAYKFTKWFNENVGNNIKDENNKKYLYIDSGNDPEKEDSLFVQHKREIIKNKIENVLNSSITAYSERTWGYNYKMPKLSEEDWQKIYSNISMITFFQGKSIGLTRYNGYCVLNSTNSNEYVNPNLMYFIDNNEEYHDIRCSKCTTAGKLTGYKMGSFSKRKVEQKDENDNTKVDENGNVLYKYEYKRNELACYYCVNGQIDTAKSIEEYISSADQKIKTAYWTSLARERYRNVLQINSDDVSDSQIIVNFDENYEGGSDSNKNVLYQEKYGELPTATREGYTFDGWYTEENGGTQITSETIVEREENHTLYAHWTPIYYTIDLNQIVNGVMDYWGGIGTVDIYINGTKVGEDIKGHYVDYPYGAKLEIKDIKAPTGYYYAGAIIRTNTESKTLAEGTDNIVITITDDTSIDLKFSNKYKVEFDVQGGNESIESREYTYGDTLPYNSLPTSLIKENSEYYSFDGWYTAVDGGNKISKDIIVTKNQTLYAHWNPRFDVNVEIDGKIKYDPSTEILSFNYKYYNQDNQYIESRSSDFYNFIKYNSTFTLNNLSYNNTKYVFIGVYYGDTLIDNFWSSGEIKLKNIRESSSIVFKFRTR